MSKAGDCCAIDQTRAIVEEREAGTGKLTNCQIASLATAHTAELRHCWVMGMGELVRWRGWDGGRELEGQACPYVIAVARETGII